MKTYILLNLLIIVISVALLAISVTPVQAATWAGGNSTDWSDPANWNPPTVPTSNDSIEIRTGTPAVPDGFVFQDLTVSGGTLSGSFILEGVFNWNSGTLKDGVTTVSPGGTLNLNSSSGKTLDGHTLNNSGTIFWSGSGPITGSNGSEFHNESGGTVNLSASGGSIRDGAGQAMVLNNSGRWVKTGSGLFDFRAFLDHSGELEVESGDVHMASGGELSGKLAAAPGSLIRLRTGDFSLNGVLEVENLDFNGGSIGGEASLEGNAIWSGGTFSRGLLSIAPGSILEVTTTSSKTMDGHTIDNAGTILWTGSGAVTANNRSALNNLPEGVIEIEGRSQIRHSSGSASTLTNEGLIRKTQGNDLFEFRLTVNNSATIEAEAGEIRLNSGGDITGELIAGPNAKVSLAGGDFILHGTIQAENLHLAGATIDGIHVLSGLTVWSSGGFRGGTTTIPPESTLRIEATATKTMDNHELHNSGEVVWIQGTITANNGSVVENEADALFQMTDATSIRASQGSPVTFRNLGRLRKTDSTGSTDIRAVFINSGRVTAASGNLRFSESFNQIAGETRLNGGTFSFNRAAEIEGGVLTGSGTVSGDVINGGVVSPGGQGIGTITIEGNYIQQPGGRTLFEIRGLNPGTEFDLLAVTRKATLEGNIVAQFTGNFLPEIGNTFTVLEYASHEGTAELTDMTLALEPEYTPSMLTLITEREPVVFELVRLEIREAEGQSFTIQFQAQPERSYQLQGSTDLRNWIDISETSGDGQVEIMDMPPANINHRFYRVLVR